MYYFGYYAHQEPQDSLPARPRHKLHPIDKAAFMQRWNDFHLGITHQGELLHPPLLTLPSRSLGLPPSRDELEQHNLPTHLAGLKYIDQHTDVMIPPPPAERFHCDIPRPYHILEDEWELWLPVVEDHLMYSGLSWSERMWDFAGDPETFAVVEGIRYSVARYWAEKSLQRPFTYARLVELSQRYGHNLQAMLNWLLDDLKLTKIPRININNFKAPEDIRNRFTVEWPQILDDDYAWWSKEAELNNQDKDDDSQSVRGMHLHEP